MIKQLVESANQLAILEVHVLINLQLLLQTEIYLFTNLSLLYNQLTTLSIAVKIVEITYKLKDICCKKKSEYLQLNTQSTLKAK